MFDKDMKKLTIIVLAFEKKNPDTLNEVLRIKNVPVDRNVLAGIGQSFVLSRRLLHRGSRELDEDAAADASSRDESSDNPTKDSDDSVKLEIFYDDKPVSLESDPASPARCGSNDSRRSIRKWARTSSSRSRTSHRRRSASCWRSTVRALCSRRI